MDPYATATEIAAAIRAGKISAREVVDAHLARIDALNPKLNAIVTLDAERARARAKAADEASARGDWWGPLHGVPFTLKDAHSTEGVRTTVGAPALSDHVPARDGTVAARLKAAGGILLGKTNVPPMLMSAQTENPIFGRTLNPWDVSRTPGGSSGGAGAAVAAALAPFDVGSDMSGSIRMPAHFCGIYGLKPTANRIPTTGHLPPPPGMPRPERFMGAVGPMARSTADLGLVTRLLVGPDGFDHDVPPVPWNEAASPEPRKLRIAFLSVFPGVKTSAIVRDVVARVASDLERAGARVEERDPGFTIPELNEVWRVNMRILGSVLGELGAIPLPAGGSGAAAVGAVDVVRLLHGRDQLITKLETLLREFDVFLSPVSISTAFPCSPPRTPIPVDDEPVDSRFVDHYVYPFNLTGHPAVVLPAGLGTDGLPVGIQLVGAMWRDERLLSVASAIDGLIAGYRTPPQPFAR